jgi:hypothetical protein
MHIALSPINGDLPRRNLFHKRSTRLRANPRVEDYQKHHEKGHYYPSTLCCKNLSYKLLPYRAVVGPYFYGPQTAQGTFSQSIAGLVRCS